jgi:hypothetical protein
VRHSAQLVTAALWMAILVPAASAPGERPISAFADGLPGAVIAFAFPREIVSSGKTVALATRDAGYAFRSLGEVNQYNVGASHLIPDTAHTLNLQNSPLESPWWWAVRSPEGARAFVAGLRGVLQQADDAPIEAASVLSKALLQRDLIHVYALLFRAREQVDEPALERVAAVLQGLLAEQIERVLLSEDEYRALVALRPKSVPKGFVATPAHSLSSQYLPARVLAADPSWMEIPHTGSEAFRHYMDYGGRSWIRVYVRAAHLDAEQMRVLWQKLYRAHGADLHVTGTPHEVPVRFESMLVRSFGVFASDGSFRDSTWPEEVIIRAFKYSQPQVDLTTSDFRGTLFYQYKMLRSDLLRDPGSLGLRRVHDDDEQFFGFFGDVPDPGNAYSDTTTTMRANCISCHSELFYGLATIFSFERDPDSRSPANEPMPPQGGRYDVHLAALRSLSTWLDPEGG